MKSYCFCFPNVQLSQTFEKRATQELTIVRRFQHMIHVCVSFSFQSYFKINWHPNFVMETSTLNTPAITTKFRYTYSKGNFVRDEIFERPRLFVGILGTEKKVFDSLDLQSMAECSSSVVES